MGRPPYIESLPVVMKNTLQDQPFSVNISKQVHVRTADDIINPHGYEIKVHNCHLYGAMLFCALVN